MNDRIKNINEIMYALARVLGKPCNPLYAMQDFFENISDHGAAALQEWTAIAKLLPLADYMHLVAVMDAFGAYLREGKLLTLLETMNKHGAAALKESDEVEDMLNALDEPVAEEVKIGEAA
jgi:hypothetical protein